MQQQIYQNPGLPVFFGNIGSGNGGLQTYSVYSTSGTYTVGTIVYSAGLYYVVTLAQSGSGTLAANCTQINAYNFTPSNTARGAGWQSAIIDRGVGAQPAHYRWRARTKWGSTAPGVGDSVLVFLITSDGTNIDGELGSTNAAISTAANVAALQGNCQQFGAIKASSATQQQELASGDLYISERFFGVAFFVNTNNSTNAPIDTDTTAVSDHFIILTPFPDAIQPLA
jgi:hypothetical protein